MSACHPEANPAYVGQFAYKSQDERDIHIHRVIGQIPAIAAATLRIYNGHDIVEPDEKLGYVTNFLRMAFGPESKQWQTEPIVRALETLFILHAEHELNCSTAAVRHMTSSLADIYTSLSGAVTALYGPRHGGANEAVLKMLEEIGHKNNVPEFIEQVKRKQKLLMGFGHRVYKNYDPRASIVKQLADEVFKIMRREELVDSAELQVSLELIEIAQELERIALTDEYFITRKLYPNVDFYSGVIYKAMGFPTEFFTVLFALPRFTGWLSHWNEFCQDPDNKIVRPRQIYLGERSRNYTRMNDREQDELAPYKIVNLGRSKLELFTIPDRDEASEMSVDSKNTGSGQGNTFSPKGVGKAPTRKKSYLSKFSELAAGVAAV